MTPVEWIAVIISIWVFVKFIILSVNPKGFLKWGAKMWSKDTKFLKYLYLVLFFLIAYLVLQEITIVQFFVAMLAGMMLMSHTFTHYPKVMKTYISQFRKSKNPNAKIMFDWLIWFVIAAWVLKTLFF